MKSSYQTITVPNMDQFVRDSTDLGPLGALLKRLRQLSPSQLLRLIWHQLPCLPLLLRQDFATAIILLADIELIRYPYLSGITLDATITDLALALDNRQLLNRFMTYIRSHYHVPTGFTTHNPNHLRIKLGQWRLSSDIIKTHAL